MDNTEVEKRVTIGYVGDEIDQGDRQEEGEIAVGSCTISHTVSSADLKYNGEKSQIEDLTVLVLDDDVADVNLYTLSPDSYGKISLQASDWASSYKVKFLNFFCPEGDMVAYGVRLESQPTTPVVIKPNVTLVHQDKNSTVLFPPSLQADPAELTFTAANWNIHQRVKLTYLEDNVDHNNNRFQVVHNIETTDPQYSSLPDAVLAMVDISDDDTAGVTLKSISVLSLQEASANFKYAEINNFGSQPVADVTIMANISSAEHRGAIETDPASGIITITKENWNTHTGKIGFRALAGVLPNDPGVSLRVMSDDPKYQYPALPEITVATTIDILSANMTGYMQFLAAVSLDFTQYPSALNYNQYPSDLSVNENLEVKYKLQLAQNVKRTKNVTVYISVAPTNGFSCSVSPSVS